jgi:beta-galactosidase
MFQPKQFFNLSFILILCFINTGFLQSQKLSEPARVILNFDTNWRFFKGDAAGAENPSFDDSGWRRLDVPHDWSIEGPYDQTNPTSRGGGYLPAGAGWYRKSFTVNPAGANKKYSIEFDGIMANSDVWINGFHLGKCPYGYTSFSYDLTGHLKTGKGEKNTIAVRADNSVQPASRYYTGAGIYRHVRLVTTGELHIRQWGVHISTIQASREKGSLTIETTIINEASSANNITITNTILDPDGKSVFIVVSKENVPSGKEITVSQSVEIKNPRLWDIGSPFLYKAVTSVSSGKVILDEDTNTFGIRDSRFEAATGYWLNGRNIKIKGVCLHHDAGGLGSAVPLRAWERRLALLREAGVNAIRTGHNPFDPGFLDLCDRMGFLVLDETFDTWTAAKPNGEKGYNLYFRDWWEKDTRNMVMRDRNHPSIILYSVGNEIRDNLNDSTGFKKYRDQQDLIHKLDPGIPVTMALFRPNASKVYSNGFVEKMDIVGQNYRENELVELHQAKPHLKVIGTENGHGLTEWLILRDNPYMAGQFLWTGIDYLGEALWPAISFNKALFDRTGEWTQPGLQRQSWWSEKPVVHIVRKSDNAGTGEWVADWSPVDEGTYDDARLEVYSNCDEVELFLNGRSLGIKTRPADDSPRTWQTTFEKGSLKAIGRNKGLEVASEELRTAGTPAKIILKADKPVISGSWEDVSYVTAAVADADGIICPNSRNLISFSVSEPGIIAAVDSGDPNSHESYKAGERQVFKGKCVVIIRGVSEPGKISVTASSPGLATASAEIEVKNQPGVQF